MLGLIEDAAEAQRRAHEDLLTIHRMVQCPAEVSPEHEPDEHLTVRAVRALCVELQRRGEESRQWESAYDEAMKRGDEWKRKADVVGAGQRLGEVKP